MLHRVTQIDEAALRGLLAVYAESMQELACNFPGEAEMQRAYAEFLRDFVQKPGQRIYAELSDGDWVSALRAIETRPGHWFLEAVETRPGARRRGFGAALLRHTAAALDAQELTCTISKHNHASQALHAACGFVPTDAPPRNCWGETEEGTILYRLTKQ